MTYELVLELIFLDLCVFSFVSFFLLVLAAVSGVKVKISELHDSKCSKLVS